MHIQVIRDIKTDNSVTSIVTYHNSALYYGLEPPNPIPAGIYEAWLRWSAHNHGWVIAVMNVPGHTDIEVHIGNTPKDTKDCLVVGMERHADYVTDSRLAFQTILGDAVSCVEEDERITIEYIDKYKVANVNQATA